MKLNLEDILQIYKETFKPIDLTDVGFQQTNTYITNDVQKYLSDKKVNFSFLKDINSVSKGDILELQIPPIPYLFYVSYLEKDTVELALMSEFAEMILANNVKVEIDHPISSAWIVELDLKIKLEKEKLLQSPFFLFKNPVKRYEKEKIFKDERYLEIYSEFKKFEEQRLHYAKLFLGVTNLPLVLESLKEMPVPTVNLKVAASERKSLETDHLQIFFIEERKEIIVIPSSDVIGYYGNITVRLDGNFTFNIYKGIIQDILFTKVDEKMFNFLKVAHWEVKFA